LHDPETTLAGGRILPNQVGLTGTKEVCRTRDVPLSGDSRKIDTVGVDAVLEDPDTVLSRNCVFPNEVSLAVTVEVLGNPSAWRRVRGRWRRARGRREMRAVNRPKTPTEFVVPTNTLPLQIVGAINLLASPN